MKMIFEWHDYENVIMKMFFYKFVKNGNLRTTMERVHY